MFYNFNFFLVQYFFFIFLFSWTQESLSQYYDLAIPEMILSFRLTGHLSACVSRFGGFTFHYIYRKNPKNSDTENIVVVILKFEQRGFTIEKCVQKR